MATYSQLRLSDGTELILGKKIARINGLTWRVVSDRARFDGTVTMEFTIAPPHVFVFWRSLSKPNPSKGSDLYLVPSYHPVMQGMSSVAMLNGDTDYYIGGTAIETVHCPESARSVKGEYGFGSTWTHVYHPFYVTGNSFTMQVFPEKLQTREGGEELFDFLCAALGLTSQYVEINGGFRAPLRSAHNRLVDLGIPSPYPQASYETYGNRVRGCEDYCVWAYRTLQREGVLEQAYIPAWFISEGWLKIYEGIEEQAGTY